MAHLEMLSSGCALTIRMIEENVDDLLEEDLESVVGKSMVEVELGTGKK